MQRANIRFLSQSVIRLSNPSRQTPKLEPTTFSEKASPRQVHERPENLRGLPSSSPPQFWTKPGQTTKINDAKPGSMTGEEFGGPSRPRMVYDRPKDLPKLRSRWPMYAGVGALCLSACVGFVLWATNTERLASSVLRQVTFQLRNSAQVASVLGENVRLADNWWGFGDPWISGSINNMQGHVDLSFRVRGSHGAGTVYFTSIRPKQEGAWRIVRYKIITDDGQTIRLDEQLGA
ncbi:hypothetical protein TREMEDRAFT_74761 [Tremella mesenterica DSM 1558]|uniref:uncharacterized protein n=1 Tax=Tremella mesenterica (strain ATCC 24925 / CBS 8224 / DSM 1558 / NBRC 9311 / NRRL Y-6157 / RJB 2259-6 / UBC 559-6) TaxID=578456 RepID=UPI00032CA6EC|nr:uncharacterized protein TREMEDRAFT_74761 [Tremella mesenterica DSM 1558]EIW66621.1 hypothetical protein TREMEDRAFT_74761 [Tremella mesenterica DSM 1558]